MNTKLITRNGQRNYFLNKLRLKFKCKFFIIKAKIYSYAKYSCEMTE